MAGRLSREVSCQQLSRRPALATHTSERHSHLAPSTYQNHVLHCHHRCRARRLRQDRQVRSRATSPIPFPRRADEAPGVSRGVRPDPSSSIRLARRSLGSRSRVAVKLAPRVAKISAPRARAAGKVMAMADGKKKILRENEKEAWLSEMEREGANPLTDPMAMVAIGGITVPFVILAIAGALGYIGQ